MGQRLCLFLAGLENSVLRMSCDISRETLKVASVVCKRNVGPTLRKVKLRSSEFAVIERVS